MHCLFRVQHQFYGIILVVRNNLADNVVLFGKEGMPLVKSLQLLLGQLADISNTIFRFQGRLSKSLHSNRRVNMRPPSLFIKPHSYLWCILSGENVVSCAWSVSILVCSNIENVALDGHVNGKGRITAVVLGEFRNLDRCVFGGCTMNSIRFSHLEASNVA